MTTEKTIFVIDDEQDFGELVKEYISLHHPNCKVLVFNNLNDPLDLIEGAARPDLVITDLKLNKSSGAKLSEVIKSNPATANIPVIIMSAHFHERTVTDALASGADQFLAKPFTSEQLKNEVGRLIKLD